MMFKNLSIIRRILPLSLVEFLEDIRYLGLPVPIKTVRPHTLLSNLNLFFLKELAQRVERMGIPGDFVECGVYRGGSAGVLAYETIDSKIARRLWLYDAFAGMPAASELDDKYSVSIQGQFIGSEAQTRRIMQRLNIPEENFEIVVGWFEDTLPKAEKCPIALLHIDCDFYDPVKLSLETFYQYVQPGGYVVINDYGAFQGCRVATDEFLNHLDEKVQLVQIDQEAYFFQKPQ